MSVFAGRAREWVLVGAIFFATLLTHSQLNFWQALERYIYDTQVAWNNRAVHSERRIVIIDIDENSIHQLGPWPWPRERLAQLIDKLFRQYQVQLVGLDIVFPDARPGDERLKAVLRQYPVVMAQAFDLAPHSRNHSGLLNDGLQLTGSPIAPIAQGYIGNSPSLISQGQAVGHITPMIDTDGKVRRIHPILCYQPAEVKPLCNATLGLRMYMQLNQLNALQWRESWLTGHYLLTVPDTGLGLPVNQEGFTLIPYRLIRSDFLVFSAQDVLTHQVSADALQGAIVLIGSTALGLGDRVSTPRDQLTAGIELHAQILSSILDRDWLIQAPAIWVYAGNILWAIIAGVAMLVWTRRGYFLDQCWWAFAALLVWWFINQFLWQVSKVYVPIGFGWSFILMTLFGVTLLEQNYFRQRFNQIMQGVLPFLPQGLSEHFQQRSTAHQDSYGPVVQEVDVVVLIADIVGYTKMIQGRNSAIVAELMQQFISCVGDVMHQTGGEIDKFTGDGVVVLWSANKSMAERAQDALRAAELLEVSLRQLIPWLLAHDFQPIQMSIGMNAGSVALGSFGRSRLTYTAHGDVMNVAAKLERLTRQIKKYVLLAPNLVAYLLPHQYEELGAFELDGRDGLIRVYAPKQKKVS